MCANTNTYLCFATYFKGLCMSLMLGSEKHKNRFSWHLVKTEAILMLYI